MEITNNLAPDPLSIRADVLTKEIEKHNSALVEIACMLQLLETDTAFLSIRVHNEVNFKTVGEFETDWNFATHPDVYRAAAKTLRSKYEIYIDKRAICLLELNAIELQLQAMGKEG